MQQLFPILALLFVGGVVWLVVTMLNRGDTRTDDRLDRIKAGPDVGHSVMGGPMTGTERFQDMLERAAPALSKPLKPKTEEEESALKIYLANGGWRGEKGVSVFLGIQLFSLLLGLGVAVLMCLSWYGFTTTGLTRGFMVAGIMFYLPRVFVWWVVRKRQEQIFLGMPDALDLLVVCVEAGLGLDAAMRKVCEEMGQTYPIISEEFSICNFQLQMGRPRREVLHDLGVRTGVDDMKAMVAILIQADRFGSSIAQALRVQSDSMRVRRRQLAEERAAKTAVQLVFPLVLFIFPAIFIVLVGPAGIQIVDSLAAME
jgi:tight adherence protein C